MILGLAQKAQHVKFLLNENSPTILTSLGVVGTVSTAYLTGRATFKAAEIIEEEKKTIALRYADQNSDDVTLMRVDKELTRFRKVGLVWKEYIPSVGSGVVTITCIIMANRIASTKIAALTVASAISERSLQEYKKKVFDKIGEREEQKVRDEIIQDRVNKYPPSNREIILAGTGEVLCYDEHSGRYFQSSVEEIKRAENKMNHELLNFMRVSLSEFYQEIGLPPTSYSDHVGWNANNRIEIAFSAVLTPDNRPCMGIDFVNPPSTEYHEKFLHD